MSRLPNNRAVLYGDRQASQQWTVPFGVPFVVPSRRNRKFVGRQRLLAQLLERIAPGLQKDDCQRTAIVGLGGIGKTQIALEAAYRIRERYPECSIFWIRADSIASFEHAYLTIGQLLKIENTDEAAADFKSLVRDALSQENAGDWLLIVDGVDDDILFRATSLSDYLPFSQNGSILFTTRNREIALNLSSNIVNTTELSTSKAMELFRVSLDEPPSDDSYSIGRLLDYLGNLPLTITLASAFISTTQVSITEYLGLVTNNSILAVWKLSFEQISMDKPLAADYLTFMCFLSDSAIPISLLPSTDDEIETHEAIDTLKAYSFITGRENAGSVDMQRLVREATLAWLEKEGKRGQYATLVMRRLAEVLSCAKHEHSKMWLEYLPHVQTALKSLSNCTDKKAECQVISWMAEYRYATGDYQQAELLYRESLRLRPTEESFETELASMNHLAYSVYRQVKYEEAEQIHRQGLILREKSLGNDDPDTLASRENLALILEARGEWTEAEQIYRQTLETRRKSLGEKHPDTLATMAKLAISLQRQGNNAAASPLENTEVLSDHYGEASDSSIDGDSVFSLPLSVPSTRTLGSDMEGVDAMVIQEFASLLYHDRA